VADLQDRVRRLEIQRSGLLTQHARMCAEISRLENEDLILDQVLILYRDLLDREIGESVSLVERLMNEGLKSIFPDQDLRVKGQIEVSRGKVSVRFLTHQRDGGFEVEGSSDDAFGGAVTTVQSLLLRVILIMLKGMRRVMFLDETLPAFDGHYVTHAGDFLRAMCEKLEMDCVLVTHNPSLVECAHRAYRIEKVGGEARFIRSEG